MCGNHHRITGGKLRFAASCIIVKVELSMQVSLLHPNPVSPSGAHTCTQKKKKKTSRQATHHSLFDTLSEGRGGSPARNSEESGPLARSAVGRDADGDDADVRGLEPPPRAHRRTRTRSEGPTRGVVHARGVCRRRRRGWQRERAGMLRRQDSLRGRRAGLPRGCVSHVLPFFLNAFYSGARHAHARTRASKK